MFQVNSSSPCDLLELDEVVSNRRYPPPPCNLLEQDVEVSACSCPFDLLQLDVKVSNSLRPAL